MAAETKKNSYTNYNIVEKNRKRNKKQEGWGNREQQ